MRNSFLKLLNFILLPLLLFTSGCKDVTEGDPAYQLANQCIAIGSYKSGKFLSINPEDNQYQFTESNAQSTNTEKFFIKATALGKFLLYDRSEGMLSSGLLTVKRKEEASSKVVWRVNNVNSTNNKINTEHLYTVSSDHNNGRIVMHHDKLYLAYDEENQDEEPDLEKAGLYFLPVDKNLCLDYPEASLDAVADNTSPSSVLNDDNTVNGYADFHTHIAFPKALGAVTMSGDAFHPLGVAHALDNCQGIHGENGELDLLESQNAPDGDGGHSTEGFPKFEYWPNRTTNTHMQAYYKWIERAHLSGLRLMVTSVTGNPYLCQIMSTINFTQNEGDCKSDTGVALQIQYIYQLQDYIDAQEGGPGKGWFRIATSSKQAREIIGQGKLAVVLGSEYGTLFDCTEGAEHCTEQYIEDKLDEIYELGIRSVFPIHRFDNAFGGTRPQGGFGGAWMNLSSKLSTGKAQSLFDLIDPAKLLFKPIEGHFWELEQCPDGIWGTQNMRSMEAFIEEDFSFLRDALIELPIIGPIAAKILDWTVIDKLKPLPAYDGFTQEGQACNVRPLQDKGRALLGGLVNRGMIVEIDHMSYPTLMQTLSFLESYRYPGVVSSHSWFENTPEIRHRIFGLGGLIAPFNDKASNIADIITMYSEEQSSLGFGYAGVGIGTDIQGVVSQAEADNSVTVEYPFESLDGATRFTQPIIGDREISYKDEGIVHYGLLPEWVENLRLVDEKNNTQAIDILMQSAEAYLQMWERTEAFRNR